MVQKQNSIRNLVKNKQANFDNNSPNYIATGAAGLGGAAGIGGAIRTARRAKQNNQGFLQQGKQDVQDTGRGINQGVRNTASSAGQRLRNAGSGINQAVRNPGQTAKNAVQGVGDDIAGVPRDFAAARAGGFGRGISGASAAKRFAGTNTGKAALGTTLLGLGGAGINALTGDNE